MSMNQVVQKSEPVLSKRRLGWASCVAFVSCAAACSLPLLVALGVGSGAAATVTRFLKPGSELFVGGASFAIALGAMVVWGRVRTRQGQSCGGSSRA